MNNEIPFGFDPGSTHFPQQHIGPQLTEHTGNRIATALERIADALEKSAKPPTMAYPLGDPAPFDPTKPLPPRNDWMST